MKTFTLRKRYIIWTGIWIILFTVTLSLLPRHYWFAVPMALWGMVGAGFVKDAWDQYLINHIKEPFLYPYFEHMPLMAIVAVYSMYSFVATHDWTWAALAIAALGDAYFDWQQDKLYMGR